MSGALAAVGVGFLVLALVLHQVDLADREAERQLRRGP